MLTSKNEHITSVLCGLHWLPVKQRIMYKLLVLIFKHGVHRSGNNQGKKNSSRSGKCQGILFWVRENWHFEEKSGKMKL